MQGTHRGDDDGGRGRFHEDAPVDDPPVLREVGDARREPASAPVAEMRLGLATTCVEQDPETRRLRYVLREPGLSPEEENVLAFVKDSLVRTLRGFPEEDTPEARERYLLEKIAGILQAHGLAPDPDARARLEYHLLRNLLGYDRIHALLHDPQIEDISCDGPGIPVFVHHRRYGSLRTNVAFPDDATLDAFVVRMAERCGKHINIANPILDATLPDRSRLQATLSREVTSRGSSFTIRKFREDPVSPVDLVASGTMSAEMVAYWWLAVESGLSAIIAGGTASGKTTTLNAVSLLIPPDRKIVSIEDTRELNVPHDNWIASVTRAGFGDAGADGGTGRVDTFKLLEAALRQRPEYLLVGEVRGREAFTLFQAMATGHATYATMHADAAESAVRRLENPPIGVPRLMLAGLDVMAIQAQSRVNGRAVRRVSEIVEFLGTDPDTGELLTNTAFRWDPREDAFRHASRSYVLERVATRRGVDVEDVLVEWSRRARLVDALHRAGHRDHAHVADAVARYHTDPEGTLADAFAAAGVRDA